MIRRESLLGRLAVRLDWGLLAAVLALAGVGLLLIHSATFRGGMGTGFVARQAVAWAAGLTGMAVLALVPYQVFQTYARGIYGFGVALLIAVLAVGVRQRGSKSWFDLGVVHFQPVEIARLCALVGLAAWADLRRRDIHRWSVALVALGVAFLPVALILLQPDLSSALVLGPMTLAVLYAAGAPVSFLISVTVVGVIALGIPLTRTYFALVGDRYRDTFLLGPLARCFLEAGPFWILWGSVAAGMVVLWAFLRRWRVFVPGLYVVVAVGVLGGGVGGSFVVDKALKNYQRKRLIAFVDPAVDPLGAGYNIVQSKIAIGSGRLWGKGYQGGSQTQLGFLPEKHTDFVFSLLAEELGFWGAGTVLTVFFVVAWRALDIAVQARENFGRLLAVGVGVFFAASGLINIGMVMGLMPVTGVPLPFMSYGGSGLVGSYLAVGLLLSIHSRRHIL
jgi:rod shape determining protein RodA